MVIAIIILCCVILYCHWEDMDERHNNLRH